MNTSITRRNVLAVAGAGAVSIAMARVAKASELVQGSKPDPLPGNLVREFVSVAHGDLEKTRKMLDEHPSLLNATWDWGGGDFEMGIGGAGHVGSKEVARYLLSKGARMDIFVAAMLGEVEIVRATLTAFPQLKESKGPHGLSLLKHAQAGRDKEMLQYLRSLE